MWKKKRKTEQKARLSTKRQHSQQKKKVVIKTIITEESIPKRYISKQKHAIPPGKEKKKSNCKAACLRSKIAVGSSRVSRQQLFTWQLSTWKVVAGSCRCRPRMGHGQAAVVVAGHASRSPPPVLQSAGGPSASASTAAAA